MKTREKKIKLVEAQGTHEEIGYAIGTALKEETQKNIETYLRNFKEYKGISFEELVKMAEPAIETCRTHFPEFLEELRGMAEGAELNRKTGLKEMLLLNLEEELEESGHCTSIAAKTGNDLILGHNEDWEMGYDLYMIKARPDKKPAFLSLSYAGQLPGTSVGLNEHGLAYSADSLETKVNLKGLPKVYLLRDLLEAKNLKEIDKLLSKGKKSIGNHCMVVSEKDNKIASVEWVPEIHKILGLNGRGFGAHSNQPLSPELLKNSTASEEAVREYSFIYRRAMSLLHKFKLENNLTIDAFKKILSDHEGRKELYSICNHLQEKDPEACQQTIASAVVDVRKRQMQIAYGNPCRTKYTTYSLR